MTKTSLDPHSHLRQPGEYKSVSKATRLGIRRRGMHANSSLAACRPAAAADAAPKRRGQRGTASDTRSHQLGRHNQCRHARSKNQTPVLGNPISIPRACHGFTTKHLYQISHNKGSSRPLKSLNSANNVGSSPCVVLRPRFVCTAHAKGPRRPPRSEDPLGLAL